MRAWVHIADVSAYVPAGSPLDRDAAERRVSTYVPGHVAPMLPHELSDDLCSLRPHQDRRCVTVEILFGAGLEPGEPRFYRSLIRSRERLTYGHAQAVLAGDERAVDELGEALRLAEQVTRALRDRRFERGALRVEGREVEFAFDGDGGVERAWIEKEPLAHMLVEEMMIAANEAVAELLAGRGRDALYRVHERPDPQSVELLLAKLADLEVPAPPVPEHLSPAEAARLAAAGERGVMGYVGRAGRGEEAFPALVLRALKQARYGPENLGHSGLASRAYCHFTSPIRRYPDLVVHRALLRELGVLDVEAPDDLVRPGRLDLRARARRDPGRVPRRRPLPRLAAGAAALRGGLGRDLRGRDHRRDRLRDLRPLRRRVRGLPSGPAAARRLLRALAARHRPRRPPQRLHVPARRPDRGLRGGAEAVGGKGRAGASRAAEKKIRALCRETFAGRLRGEPCPSRLPLAPSTGRE